MRFMTGNRKPEGLFIKIVSKILRFNSTMKDPPNESFYQVCKDFDHSSSVVEHSDRRGLPDTILARFFAVKYINGE